MNPHVFLISDKLLKDLQELSEYQQKSEDEILATALSKFLKQRRKNEMFGQTILSKAMA